MIYFITNKEHYKNAIPNTVFPDIIVINNEKEGFNLFLELIGKQKMLALDIEATGLDAYTTTPLLYGIGTATIQFMMDWTVDINPYIKYLRDRDKIILGHNLKYDIKLVAVATGIMLQKMYDTMICEQRLYMRIGYSFSYASLVQRYLNKVIVKSTRNEFIGVNIDTFKISPAHLYYLKGDLVDLFYIRKKQQVYIKHYSLEFLIYGIEFPLISVIAKAELEGFVLDQVKWKQRLQTEILLRHQVEIEADKVVRDLRDYVSINNLYKSIDPKLALGGGKYDHTRELNPMYDMFKSNNVTTILDIFGEPMSHQTLTGLKRKVVTSPNNISYSAKKEIVFIFAALNQPMITPFEQYVVPKLDGKGKLIGSIHDFTIKEDFLQKYILRKPDSIMIPFIHLIIKHSKLSKAITTYGESFIEKLNPVTGKLHTAFRQCFANTGRFQSGGGDLEPDKPNFQNIPAKPEYRMAFTVEEGYSVLTADYSGAELIVMASHAQDHKLLEISKGDMHSYMATKCWRNIFGYRAKQLLNLFTKNPNAKTESLVEDYQDNVDKYKTYEVTAKTGNKRKEFKPMTFNEIFS